MMTSVGFYHLTKTNMEQALPSLLIRTMQQKERAVVWCRNNDQVSQLTEVLWDIINPVWLPHGCHTSDHQDEFSHWQPIWLTVFEENPNEAAYLFMVHGQNVDQINQFKRVFDLFDGNDELAVQAARERWRRLKQAGHQLTYWKQTEKGWEKG